MTATVYSLTTAHDTHGARRLGAANRPTAGVLVAAVPPDLRRGFELGWELLAALGKRDDVTGSGRNHEQNWDLVCSWLVAHPVRHLVLLDSQYLSAVLLGDVAGLAASCGLTVWLVAHLPVSDAYAAALAPWPVSDGDQRALAEVVAHSERQRAQLPVMEEFPRVSQGAAMFLEDLPSRQVPRIAARRTWPRKRTKAIRSR